jgi:hypothetical protein
MAALYAFSARPSFTPVLEAEVDLGEHGAGDMIFQARAFFGT